MIFKLDYELFKIIYLLSLFPLHAARRMCVYSYIPHYYNKTGKTPPSLLNILILYFGNIKHY